ncbi:MAG TPA: hypothetical protein LFV90_07525 [Rickettsia endosymbiont of Columbicola hoogstraali]|nr:hypothetical protein [Rickettsia endosymbiont of Columbicola hoogstraali]
MKINQDIFTSKDILLSDYFIKTLIIVFGKPNPKNQSHNEYNKFVSQPLDLLSYANVLQ